MLEGFIELNDGEGTQTGPVTGPVTGTIAGASDAVTTSTANTVVKRDAYGYVRDRVPSPWSIMPGTKHLAAALGYTTLDALWTAQELAGNLRLGGPGNGSNLTVTNSPTYGRMSDAGSGESFQGIYFDTDGDCFGFQQDVFDFGTGSAHLAIAFERVTDTGAVQSLIGRYAATRYLFLQISAADKLQIGINDGTRSALDDVAATTLVAGGIYLAQFHLRKDAGTLNGRLSKWGTGLLNTESTRDVSLYTTLAGGTTPGFAVGAGVNWGTGINVLGAMLRRGTDVNVSGRMAALASLLGFE